MNALVDGVHGLEYQMAPAAAPSVRRATISGVISSSVLQ